MCIYTHKQIQINIWNEIWKCIRVYVVVYLIEYCFSCMKFFFKFLALLKIEKYYHLGSRYLGIRKYRSPLSRQWRFLSRCLSLTSLLSLFLENFFPKCRAFPHTQITYTHFNKLKENRSFNSQNQPVKTGEYLWFFSTPTIYYSPNQLSSRGCWHYTHIIFIALHF